LRKWRDSRSLTRKKGQSPPADSPDRRFFLMSPALIKKQAIGMNLREI
jgi:hypothetical protein